MNVLRIQEHKNHYRFINDKKKTSNDQKFICLLSFDNTDGEKKTNIF